MARPWRYYETTLMGERGASARVISVPVYGGGSTPPVEIADELELKIYEVELAAAEILPNLLRWSDRDPESADLAAQLVYAPVVIIEESPPIGRALGTLAWSGGGAVLVETGAGIGVLVAYGTAWALAWLVRFVVEHIQEGVGKAFEDEARERTAAWLRRHRS
jgi:hypothetical protein